MQLPIQIKKGMGIRMDNFKTYIVDFYEKFSTKVFGNNTTKTSRSLRILARLSPITLALCIFFYTIVGVAIVATGCSRTTTLFNSDMQEDIAKELLRFHVIANSDSTEDQNVKLKVKEAIVTYLKPYLKDTTSKTEAMNIIREQLESLNVVADNTLSEYGFSYSAKSSLSSATFPIKVYGDITLPPGEYDALRIELGKAEGQNWWCIMFPQLCFVDATYSVVPEDSKKQLKNLLTEDEYKAIVGDDVDVVVKFKLVEWFKNIFHQG